MTRKELESACRFMMAFESDLSIEDINRTFGVQLEESSSHEQALSAYLENASIKLDEYPNNKLKIAKETITDMKQYKHFGKNSAVIIVIAKDLDTAKVIIKDKLEYEVENFYGDTEDHFNFEAYPIYESPIVEGLVFHQRDNSWD
ncbi:hypothetical protein [Sphingobacterium multivorum]|uniref:hypothetical protein n=1 Tax=Sphingobacterium multivorum TaxID=28454 RepID=UPI0031BA150F